MSNWNRTLLGLNVVGILALIASLTRSGPDASAIAPATAAAPAVVPKAVTPTEPEFIAKARKQFADACDLAQTNKAAARAALRPLATNEQLPADLTAAAASLHQELSLPELSQPQKQAMREATAAMLAADDLRRTDENTNEIRPAKRSFVQPLTRVVELVTPIVAAEPKYLPAHLTLALAWETQGEYAKAAASFTEYLRQHENLELPASESSRDVRRRLFVAQAKAKMDADLTTLVIGRWTYVSVQGSTEFPAPPATSVMELRVDGTCTGQGQINSKWQIQNRVLIITGIDSRGQEWANAGLLDAAGTTMIGVNLHAGHRVKYTKLP